MKNSALLPLLKIRNLSVAFHNAEPVTHQVSFDLFAGKTTALVGESGSGKSVTSAAIMGLLPPSGQVISGTVTHMPSGDHWVNPSQPLGAPRGKGLSMVFQDPMSSLNPSMRVGWQVAEVLIVHEGLSGNEARLEVEKLLNEVELPDPKLTFDKYPHELSGGQKQRIMLALALAAKPEILIADEPTTALDVTVQQSILNLLLQLQKKRGLSILFITHDLDVVRDIADHVVVLKNGRVVEMGPVANVLLQPQHEYTQALLSIRNRKPHQEVIPPTHSMVTAKGVWKSFPTKRNIWGKPIEQFDAVKNVTVDIKRGQRIGLVGESGSGKSTLGRIILGLSPLSKGEITLAGTPVLHHHRASMSRIRKTAQLVFQDPYSALNPKMRIGQAIQEVLHQHGTAIEDAEAIAIQLLEEVGLEPSDAERYPGSFSGGQRQRIVIARALAVTPEFLVLDESVAALDVQIQQSILDLLARIGDERSLTFLFISHDLGVMESFCSQLWVMQNGQIVESGLTSEVMHSPQHPYTQQLLDSRAGKRTLIPSKISKDPTPSVS
ncbi:MAG: ABC transporter ATP-binding protein [Flavobacteriales bacterium]|nr:ABC transporter ATP-binding protein [Flavobacteriales bacterium]